MLSERDTISPDNRYRWGACNDKGTQLWSRIYSDYDECYEDYVQTMTDLRDSGENLVLYQWRGVFNLDQASMLVNDKNIYAPRLYVHEDAD